MSLADELERLAALHDKGLLSTDEFVLAKARLFNHEAPGFGGGAGAVHGALAPIGRLRRSREDRWLGGICGGVAKVTGMEAWIWRLVFSVLCFLWGTGILLYILLWIFVPDE
jgi:phage shock protein C